MRLLALFSEYVRVCMTIYLSYYRVNSSMIMEYTLKLHLRTRTGTPHSSARDPSDSQRHPTLVIALDVCQRKWYLPARAPASSCDAAARVSSE